MILIKNKQMQEEDDIQNFVYEMIELIQILQKKAEPVIITNNIYTELIVELRQMYNQEKIEFKNVSEMTNELVKLQERLHAKENKKGKMQIVNFIDRCYTNGQNHNSCKSCKTRN